MLKINIEMGERKKKSSWRFYHRYSHSYTLKSTQTPRIRLLYMRYHLLWIHTNCFESQFQKVISKRFPFFIFSRFFFPSPRLLFTRCFPLSLYMISFVFVLRLARVLCTGYESKTSNWIKRKTENQIAITQ